MLKTAHAFLIGAVVLFLAVTLGPQPQTATAVMFVPDRQVSIPWGDWIDAALLAFGGVIAAFVAVKVNGFLEQIVGKTMADRLREYTEDAVNFGINATRDAARGKQLTVDVGNEVLERALEYGVRLFPWLIDRFGGTEAQRQRIMARLNLTADSHIPVPLPPADTFAAPKTTAAVAPKVTTTPAPE